MKQFFNLHLCGDFWNSLSGSLPGTDKQKVKIFTIIKKYLILLCLQSKLIDKKIQFGVIHFKISVILQLICRCFEYMHLRVVCVLIQGPDNK